MSDVNFIYFVYGMCSMFYSIMTWIFYKRGSDTLSKTVMVLMAIIAMQLIKDVFVLHDYKVGDVWDIMTAADMVAVPLYAFVLIELCDPGTLTLKKICVQISSFVLLALLFIATRHTLFYFLEVAYCVAYGVYYAVWAAFAIRRYNRRLRENFSYDDNINLDWMKYILVFFIAILALWVLDCIIINLVIEQIYLLVSMLMWVFLCYFLYRHQSIVQEFQATAIQKTENGHPENTLGQTIRHLFENEKIWTDPNLTLSILAAKAGSNRTYISQYLNNDLSTTFFDYVNSFRIEHSIILLKKSNEKIELIAEKSGFNSRQAFGRVFKKVVGMSPETYRNHTKSHD